MPLYHFEVPLLQEFLAKERAIALWGEVILPVT